MDTLKLNIITPDREIFNGDVSELTTENEIGRLEILPNHVPMVTALIPTVTSFTTPEGEKRKLFTSTGVLRINNNELKVLAENAEWPEEIDLKRAEEAKIKAEELLKEKEKVDYKRAELKLKRAVARIKARE